ncbi:Hint domain-containing protein [Asaia astilbis]|uniref:Hint domain-containing protein n=1 Tax=Asaia astilbis TaxID=610244 RepID=UPI00047025E8|nr:Hint domain-containing protein [Asaia astilbis]
MQADTSYKTTSSAAPDDNNGIWDGYLSAGPVDLTGSGSSSGSLASSEKGRLSVNYTDRSFVYEAADGTITTGKIDKTFSLGGVENVPLGGGTLAFTDKEGRLWIFSQNAASKNSYWNYSTSGGGYLTVNTPNGLGTGSVYTVGTPSSDLWYREQKYAVQPPPIQIIKWSGYLAGGPTPLDAQRGSLNGTEAGKLYVNYADRSFSYEAADGTVTTGKIDKTFSLPSIEKMSLGGGTLAFTDEQGRLWVFSENLPSANSRWSYIPSSNGYLTVVSAPASGSGSVQTVGRGSSDLWYDERKYGTAVPEVCYLPGTLISTPLGDREIETLKAGDEIFVLRNGQKTIEEIIWTGTGFCSSRKSPHQDLSSYPIRVRKGALGEGLPSTDLLVTSEHCLFLEGALIPARMLVNDESIAYENTLESYFYHHIELQTHGLIFANGILSETYLDTGNRCIFTHHQSRHPVIPLRSKTLCWERDAAAPLRTDRLFVEPIWHKLAGRVAVPPCSQALVDPAPEIFLQTSGGQKILPSRSGQGGLMFRINPKGEDIFLRVKTRRPIDTVGPFIDDRRELGLQVTGIHVYTPNTSLKIHPNAISGARCGWHDIDSTTQRWTTEKALIPLDSPVLDDPIVIFIDSVAPEYRAS